MKNLSVTLLLAFLFANCFAQAQSKKTPVVKSKPTYKVIVKEGITYAKGLSHQSINSDDATPMPLKMDVYAPDNKSKNRPAIMLIHGGGFLGGTRTNGGIVSIANHFASRGWVAFSIDYRLGKHKGSVPQKWVNHKSKAPNKKRQLQFLAIYPAHRDAKAALRWIAANASEYHVNPDFITVGGGSAGAITAISLGISDQSDFRDELSVEQDPTLSTANMKQPYKIKTILDFWGSKVALDAYQMIYGHNRFGANNPPILIAHGTKDSTVPFSSAEELKAIYESNGVPCAYYPLKGVGHGGWKSTVDGKNLAELSFDFVVEQQHLKVK